MELSKITKLGFFCLLLLFLSVCVNASDLDLRNPNYQIVRLVKENIFIDGRDAHVQFEGEIAIDNSISEKSGFTTFGFNPEFFQWDVVENYTAYIVLTDNEGTNYTYYTSDKTPYGGYSYNVTIKHPVGWSVINFYANFTLKNRVIKTINDYEYVFFYISQIETDNLIVAYYFPNYYELQMSPMMKGELKPDASYTYYIQPKEEAQDATS